MNVDLDNTLSQPLDMSRFQQIGVGELGIPTSTVTLELEEGLRPEQMAELNLNDESPLMGIKFGPKNPSVEVIYVTDKGYEDFTHGVILDAISTRAPQADILAFRKRYKEQLISGNLGSVLFCSRSGETDNSQIDFMNRVPYDENYFKTNQNRETLYCQ